MKAGPKVKKIEIAKIVPAEPVGFCDVETGECVVADPERPGVEEEGPHEPERPEAR